MGVQNERLGYTRLAANWPIRIQTRCTTVYLVQQPDVRYCVSSADSNCTVHQAVVLDIQYYNYNLYYGVCEFPGVQNERLGYTRLFVCGRRNRRFNIITGMWNNRTWELRGVKRLNEEWPKERWIIRQFAIIVNLVSWFIIYLTSREGARKETHKHFLYPGYPNRSFWTPMARLHWFPAISVLITWL
jgi:hypothetical protein